MQWRCPKYWHIKSQYLCICQMSEYNDKFFLINICFVKMCMYYLFNWAFFRLSQDKAFIHNFAQYYGTLISVIYDTDRMTKFSYFIPGHFQSRQLFKKLFMLWRCTQKVRSGSTWKHMHLGLHKLRTSYFS